ncbi:hypothetical protein SE17_31080 [Kouleothrix aurantiaca]|uniref:Uncharacterized protein n=1 Tax=Kouleothrix aurantiaca TaxID=186479 RepID=A0A0P9CVN3_9CHLR|nr:hypothetical protein SE17_31080 [Kouleothrix aurantiaca]
MLDTCIQHLLEQVIDSPIKLQLCLLFHENPQLHGSASELANRIYRDIWSLREALHELAEDGILSETASGAEPVYGYRPRAERVTALSSLAQSYNEPFERDKIQGLLHDIASYARYRRTKSVHSAFELQLL